MSPDPASLLALFRARPGRSIALSFVPLVLAGAQSVNALVHDVTSPLVVVFVLGMVAFAVGATTHSLTTFRVESLESNLFDEP